MDIKEIYLLTAFVCSACDGDIASEEIGYVKDLCEKTKLFDGLDIQSILNKYVDAINERGLDFINDYLRLLQDTQMSDDEQLKILEIAITMIEADNVIQYSEVKFFKKLRNRLPISDEQILAVMPDKEDYLLPDIRTEEFEFDDSINFANIDLTTLK